jgi:osmotically inducible protein OsmC
MATTRHADATWSGDLLSGRGNVTAATTQVFTELPTTWASRIGEPEGVTSPEELLAAAHAVHPGRALTGYDHGADLQRLFDAGFDAVGTQRVWAR